MITTCNQWRREGGRGQGGGGGGGGGGQLPPGAGTRGAPANKKRLGLLNKGKTMTPYKFNLSLIMTGRPTCKPKYACRLL